MTSSIPTGFEVRIYDAVRAALHSIEFRPVHPEAAKRGKAQSLADIYALSFMVWGEDDDPRKMVLSISYNTNARALFCTPGSGNRYVSSSAQEARWNYAFWLQEDVAVIGFSRGKDPETSSSRDAWVRGQGVNFTDQEEKEDFKRTVALGREIEAAFWKLVVRVAQQLHASGVVSQVFGRPIPIIIHDLELSDESIAATIAANPEGLAAGYSMGF